MIRLVIADDHAVVRMRLRFVLKINPEIEVVAEAADGDEAMKAVREHNPDILLLDIRMPGRDGLSALDEILAAFPKLKVLMLSTSDAEEDIFRSIEAGARGYVVKDNRPEIIVDAVNKVAAGETYMTDQVRRIYEMRKTLPDLTPRELELLRLMARGLTNKDISSVLEISVETVKSHLRHVFAKMDVETRAEAVSEAIRRGLASS